MSHQSSMLWPKCATTPTLHYYTLVFIDWIARRPSRVQTRHTAIPSFVFRGQLCSLWWVHAWVGAGRGRVLNYPAFVRLSCSFIVFGLTVYQFFFFLPQSVFVAGAGRIGRKRHAGEPRGGAALCAGVYGTAVVLM